MTTTTIWLIVVGVIILANTAIMINLRHSSGVASPGRTPDGVLFVVCNRTWMWMMWRVFGIVLIPLGIIFLMLATSPGVDEGLAIAGTSMVVAGILCLWFAHCLRRVALEVFPDSTVRVTGLIRATCTVSLFGATQLRPWTSRYGGVDARAGRQRLFTADRSQLGYAQLIEFIRRTRPDLEIPDAGWPL